jgi:hypothetical protein
MSVKLLQLNARRKGIHSIFEDLIERHAVITLQHVIASVSVGTLMEIIRWDTFDHLTKVAERKGLLSTTSKAIMIEALQITGMKKSKRLQSAVRDLILSCKGEDLTLLKNLIDGSGSYQNLYRLIYLDVSNAECRSVILRHFASEAAKLREKNGEAFGVKILSDVDDTLYSSGGHFPAGCDKTFPKHTVYPGYLNLLKVLDRS